MPYKKRNKRTYRKRPYRRRRRNRLTIMKSPMPTVFTTKLKYSEIVSLASQATAGLASAYVFSANGLYDPNITGTGHQPRGFDELIALYNHYRVIGSKITVRMSWGHSDHGIVAGICLLGDYSVQTNQSDYTENGNNVKTVIGTNDGYNIGTVSYKTAPHKFLGMKYDEDNLRGTSSANPTEQAYYHVYFSPLNNITSTNLTMEIDIEYISQFFEPKVLTQS